MPLIDLYISHTLGLRDIAVSRAAADLLLRHRKQHWRIERPALVVGGVA